MAIPNQDTLRIHMVNVDHGDAILLEFPDYGGKAHYGIVDAGRPELVYRDRLSDYFQALVGLRDMPYQIEFVCITHPHEDHYGGLKTFLDRYAQPDAEILIRQFWDCGFRTTAKTYNDLLERIAAEDRIVFVRLAAGAEFEFGEARVYVMGPSLDLRNRFDTYGVDRNNASVVLRISYRGATAILAGDAHFDSWGKITEEFPRTSKISYFKDAKIERSEGSNQLNCQLLKVSHHGSKHGTSLEYLEKLNPSYFMITCGSSDWYKANKPGWGVEWPHPLAHLAIKDVDSKADVRYSFKDGSVVYSLSGGRVRKATNIPQLPGSPGFGDRLRMTLG